MKLSVVLSLGPFRRRYIDIGGNCGLYQFAFSTVTPPSLGTMLVRICGVVSTDYIKFACQYKNVFVPEY